MSLSNPEFIIFCGPMFSTKTSMLLLTLERYKHQKKKYVVYKPIIDDRYSRSQVVSHGGATIPAVIIKEGSDILEHLADQDVQPDVVAVDEAFMIPGVSDVLVYLFKLGITVVVSTLDLSAAGKTFDEPQKMMPWATKIEKLSSVCTICGSNAHYTHKKSDNIDEIEVGSDETYEPRCFSHHAIVNNRIVTHG
jgi:thymidine kinase